jgi:hypothetical protein
LVLHPPSPSPSTKYVALNRREYLTIAGRIFKRSTNYVGEFSKILMFYKTLKTLDVKKKLTLPVQSSLG